MSRLFFRMGLALLLAFGFVLPFSAQELDAMVTVNSDGVQGGEKALFRTLESDLRTFVNGRRWGDVGCQAGERIRCTFNLVITRATAAGTYSGELYVQSFRPVPNSNYTTPLLNVKDADVEFNYTEHQSLQFDPNFIEENLTAIIAYYAYLILGLDLDSFYPMGGDVCFRNMAVIASGAQSSGWKGWERNARRGRTNIAGMLNEGVLKEYREKWFEYHRKGLDLTDGNGRPGIEGVLPMVRSLVLLQEKRPGNMLIRMFGDAKLDEMITLLSGATEMVKEEAYSSLIKIYPNQSVMLDRLR